MSITRIQYTHYTLIQLSHASIVCTTFLVMECMTFHDWVEVVVLHVVEGIVGKMGRYWSDECSVQGRRLKKMAGGGGGGLGTLLIYLTVFQSSTSYTGGSLTWGFTSELNPQGWCSLAPSSSSCAWFRAIASILTTCSCNEQTMSKCDLRSTSPHTPPARQSIIRFWVLIDAQAIMIEISSPSALFVCIALFCYFCLKLMRWECVEQRLQLNETNFVIIDMQSLNKSTHPRRYV